MNMNRFRLHIFRYPFKGIFLLSALFSCEGKGFPLFDELDKNFRRGESVVERAVVVERKAVIIGNGIEFIITHFSADELLRQRQSIELFLVEHIKIFLAVIADETVVELYVVPDEKTAVAEFIKIGEHLIDGGRAYKVLVPNSR